MTVWIHGMVECPIISRCDRVFDAAAPGTYRGGLPGIIGGMRR